MKACIGGHLEEGGEEEREGLHKALLIAAALEVRTARMFASGFSGFVAIGFRAAP